MQQSHHITDTSGLLNILSILIVTCSFLNLMSQMVCYSEPIREVVHGNCWTLGK